MREFDAIAVFVAVMLLVGVVAKNPFVLNMLSVAAITSIVVIGLNILSGFAGQISLGHAGFVGLGAYISAILSIKFGLSPWISMFITAFIVGLVSLFVAYPTLKLKGHYLAMATLAIGEIIYMLANNLSSITGGHQGLVGIPMLSIGGFVFDNERKFYFFIWVLVFAFAFIAKNITSSAFGRALKTTNLAEQAALSFGINTHKYKIIAFVISCIYASFAGSLFAFYIGFISPTSFSLLKSINYVVMMFVGGMGSIFGGLVMAVFLEVIPNLITSLQDYWPIFNGLLLVVMVMFMPEGLGGFVRWKKRQY
ncbi:branched-chain amino acid ABC transporter permease [Hippea maritima]|uniref:ABC-type transporter, integral membrane subunit n=1 Tax=Hippea maritima (strain ATCC 700847 / DSM 10411 / MH2) TaxID=760142 RepID=F2LW41_HIPMA|nr:branched-chain amino acid ABC transporter permease [Hippea maritima]AEA33975.1 ABC-type transporter, integral membrane subunit [Hippea maritima DSM 10411]